MQEPETNPLLWGDPQTEAGSFRTSPQIPRLFRMKTKINLMTSIQCGQTVPFFFPPKELFLLQTPRFLYKDILILLRSLK